MKPIFKSIYGSFLYGTNIETSDRDYKGIYLTSSDDLLQQKIQLTYTDNTNIKSNRNNTSEDVDCQLFSFEKFLHDLVNGQTYALELLFSPKQSWAEQPDEVWLELLENKDKLISRNVTAMVGYAKKQASKYGEKGKRLDVFRDVVAWLEKYKKDKGRLDLYVAEKNTGFHLIQNKHKDFISFSKKEGVEYLDVNGVMVPLGATIEYTLSVYKSRLEEYGARAKQVSTDGGNDLKAIYHAVRIAYQAEELLKTGHITFPRPEAQLLLDIRNGNVADLDMKTLIDESFERVLQAEKISPLKPKPDHVFAKQFIMETNLTSIMKEYDLCYR